MSLRVVQSALAELFTDPVAREAFARDAGAFAAERGLDAREGEQLAALSAASIAGYAATLVRKRRAEAARLLPHVRGALGDAFAPAFAAWARRTLLPDGPAAYPRDAEAFVRDLAGRRPEPAVRAAIRADRARLAAHRP